MAIFTVSGSVVQTQIWIWLSRIKFKYNFFKFFLKQRMCSSWQFVEIHYTCVPVRLGFPVLWLCKIIHFTLCLLNFFNVLYKVLPNWFHQCLHFNSTFYKNVMYLFKCPNKHTQKKILLTQQFDAISSLMLKKVEIYNALMILNWIDLVSKPN